MTKQTIIRMVVMTALGALSLHCTTQSGGSVVSGLPDARLPHADGSTSDDARRSDAGDANRKLDMRLAKDVRGLPDAVMGGDEVGAAAEALAFAPDPGADAPAANPDAPAGYDVAAPELVQVLPDTPLTLDIAPDLPTDGPTDVKPDLSLPDGCSPASRRATATQHCSSLSLPPSTYNAPTFCAPELHVVAVYEGSSTHGWSPPGTVDFNADVTGAVLLLSSYEPITWTIRVAHPGALGRVVLVGYNRSTASVPAGVLVDDRTGAGGGGRISRCEFNANPNDPCITAVQAFAGGTLASIQGCYTSAAFVVE